MAMDVLISVAGKVAEYTVAPIGRQVGYLIFYKSNFKELTDHVKDLEGARDQIKHLVEAETRNGKEIETGVQNWLERVDGVIDGANQLQEDPRRAKVGCSRWSFPNLMLRHRLSRKATKMTKEVVEVQGRGKFDRVGYLPALEGVIYVSATRGTEKLESRKPIKEDIEQALRDPEVSKIGVYGLGGVGKTTLVKEVAQKAKDDKLFDAVVIAEVSQTPDLRRIQGEIADLLGLQLVEETVAGRAFRLRERIKKEKTILVILDDIWTILDLEKVGIPFGDEQNDLEKKQKKHYGCKVLMTSRNQDVLREMEAQKDFRLDVLSEEETWNLFKVKAGDLDKEPSLHQIASEVAKKCAGLPVLIVTVARALKNQDIHAWKDALNQLARNDNKELQEITYSALELSYNRLEGGEMKALFLLCATIGGMFTINDLFKYGMGLGIFNNTNTVEGARNRFHKMMSALKASCLLLEDDTSTSVKMHDIVRDVAISIASRDQHVLIKKGAELKEWPTKDSLERCPQIFLNRCDIPEPLPKRLDCPNLELFVLNSANRSLKIPDSIFEGIGNLKVLDLTRMNLSSLPTSFRFLTNLKTLCLDQCVLENIDGIGALKNLEILSLSESSMIKLSSEIGKLTHLRMLDLSKSGIEVIPPNIISSLIKLEELYMGNTSIKWEVENSTKQKENASLAELQQLSNLTALALQIREAWILPRDLKFEKLETYKIVIGDVWEWSDNIDHGTFRTLKLKLSTNIHLEHGIKALIKRVENLYLDEVEGIWNVLYQLNGEGFPLLKHLHIQNNAKIKHIIDSMERNQAQVSFPNMETLVLHNLDNLEKICHGPFAVNSFGKLRIIKVENCIQLKYLLSLSMVKLLSQLSEVEVCQCNSMKKIVFADTDASVDNDITVDKIEFSQLRSLTLKHLPTLDSFYSNELTSSITKRTYQPLTTYIPVLFSYKVASPNLETLKLSSINLNKIWDDNQHSFHKLTNLIVENCGGLKYLFSSIMVENFLNLKRLEISKCHMMEEIIASEEGNNSAASREIRFPKLETMILKDMENLKTIWHRQFDTLKTLEVKNCEKIVVVFPSSMQKTYHNLETLEVTDCASVEEIFELTYNETSSKEDTAELKEITLDRLPKLKQTWSRDPQSILSFHNLEYVCLKSCENLEYLFPLSVATNCSHLKELIIIMCGAMKEIVAKNEGSMCATTIFEFNQLNSLVLWSLQKLKSFYAGNHNLVCPSLRKINVSNCEKLNLFRTQCMSRQERTPDGKLHVSMQQPLFIVEKVIPNLEQLRINPKDTTMILQAQNSGALFTKLTFLGLSHYDEATFPDWFLQNVYSLEWLVVEWSSLKEIFQNERPESEKIYSRLKKLTLHQLPELRHICKEGSQIDSVLEVLEYLDVDACSSMINLVPSSVTFSHLTYLEIVNCNGMINLITSPTARSLAKLRTMKVKECNSLEEIMAEKGDETIYDITFINLEILMLECLPRLNRFCSNKCFLRFPLLEEVVVRQCPRMKIFSEGNTSTPNLRKVHIAENDKEWHWKDNLNGTIKNMFVDKVAFQSFNHLKLSEYPELKELWYGQLQHNIFSNLKNLVVHECEFLSDVLFQPNLLEVLMNLEELDVKDCNSLEAVFDMKDKFAKEVMVKKSTQLRKLTLSGLPKLKHVWKEDPHGTLSFQNLCEVFVMECICLKSLFPHSIARDGLQIQDLKVNSCGIEEIVAKEEGTKEIIKFVFPRLTSLDLGNLPKLKAFYRGIHTLQCKSLKIINVFNCQKLQLFKTGHISCQERAVDCKLYDSMHLPLFTTKEVLPNLENLTVNNKDVSVILQSQYSCEQLSKLKSINVSQFANEESTFPYWFLKSAPSLESLIVQCSSFTEIFQDERLTGKEGQIRISTKLKNLILHEQPELQHICKEGFQVDPMLQLLESIYVDQCSSLKILVPSSVTFIYLTYLEVANCNGLINLITSSTAKSLVKLTTMKIKRCNLLEDVVTEKEDETNNEIAFWRLEILELVSLPRLSRFCSSKCFIKFPLLEKVVVKECPRMEIFSLGDTNISNLQEVQIDDKEYRWEGDLNGTIKKMFVDMVAFYKFKHLTLSEYPELKGFWYGQLHHSMFCNLKSLVVQRCDFLSDILFPSNVLQVLHGLEELEVRDCDSLETVFDVRCMKSKEMVVKQTTRLKRLTLSGLPKLNHIWNEDPHEIISFGNLCKVDVVECKSLVNLFSLSRCQDLGHLEELNIESCGVEGIVAMEEGSTENIFCFPQLTKLRQIRLTNLKSFYLGRHSLECPSLKILNVYRCEALQMFSFDHSDFQQPNQLDEIHDMPIQQALFCIEKVSLNLEELALNGKDAMRILTGHYQQNLFYKVEILRLQCFDETPVIFLNDVFEIFPNVVILQVRNGSFESLFPVEGIVPRITGTPKQMRKLWLYELERLRYIWHEDSPLDQLADQNLENLFVRNCPSLISLGPSSISLKNLTCLEVHDCQGLIYLIASSTAKSLKQLTTLKIKNCEMIEDVVKIDEEEAEEDIIFENLEYLKFTSLSSMRSFYFGTHTFIFPSLVRFVVKECPKMRKFSQGVIIAPFLTAVEVENGKKRWKDDLNTSIEQLFIDKKKISHSNEN